MHGTEVAGPDPVAHLLEAHVLPHEEQTHKNFPVVPLDGSVPGYPPDLEVPGVLRGGQVLWKGLLRRLVDRGRGLLLERFMGPLVIVDPPEPIEGPLLGPHRFLGRTGGPGLQRTVHPFVASVLLRLAGLDPLRDDPQLDPPDRELRDPLERVGGKGPSVVRADPVREPVALEESLEPADRQVLGGAPEALAVEKKSAVPVLYRERIADPSVPGSKLALEVGRPHRVRSVHR